MSSYILKLENASFAYKAEHPVFTNINAEISENELIVIQGESGLGKSTFLKLFNRFCEIDKGRILLNDRELKEYEIDRLRGQIIYLPQLPFMIDGTIEDNLSFAFDFQAHKEKTYNSPKAEEWMSYFQLNTKLNDNALKLSTGQKQRIALIRALLLEPDILLLDEPCSSLDRKNRELIEQKIESLASESKVTVLMATHSDVTFDQSNYRKFTIKGKKLEEGKPQKAGLA